MYFILNHNFFRIQDLTFCIKLKNITAFFSLLGVKRMSMCTCLFHLSLDGGGFRYCSTKFVIFSHMIFGSSTRGTCNFQKKDIVTLLCKLGYHQTKALEINHLVVLANVDASIDSNAKR